MFLTCLVLAAVRQDIDLPSIADMIDYHTAVQLAERCDDPVFVSHYLEKNVITAYQRTQCPTQDVYRDHEGSKYIAADES